MKNPIHVLIADDHPVVRAGLHGLLRSRPEVVIVGEASDGEEAVQKCQALHPEVVLMDLRMPRLDGAAATARIRAECASTRVLILTTYDGEELHLAGQYTLWGPGNLGAPPVAYETRRAYGQHSYDTRLHDESRHALRGYVSGLGTRTSVATALNDGDTISIT